MMNSAKSGNRCSKGIKQLRTKNVEKEKELFFFLPEFRANIWLSQVKGIVVLGLYCTGIECTIHD